MKFKKRKTATIKNEVKPNKTYVWVIDQVRGQDRWILAKFFFCVFMDRDEVEVHNSQKKNEASIQPS